MEFRKLEQVLHIKKSANQATLNQIQKCLVNEYKEQHEKMNLRALKSNKDADLKLKVTPKSTDQITA